MSAIVPYIPRRNTIYAWDALQLAQHMPSESVNCIVTSPPYYGLRDYGVDGQMGLEETPEQYVASMVRLFRELRRALRKDGTLWLNLGDGYSGSTQGGSNRDYVNGGKKRLAEQVTSQGHLRTRTALPPKSMLGIPWRVAFALQVDGWILRSDIIWSKPNPMPESVTDRPTKAHEYIFLLTKSERYFYDGDAIREPYAEATAPRYERGVSETNKYASGAPGSAAHTLSQPRENIRKMTGTGYGGDGNGLKGHSGYFRPDGSVMINPMGRNKRTVWEVSTKPFTGAHFATFPEDLIEPMILAGCPKTCCAVCGAPYERVVEKQKPPESVYTNRNAPTDEMVLNGSRVNGVMRGHGQKLQDWLNEHPPKTLGFRSACTCNSDTRPGLTYDPFMGAGTTALVAQKLKRDYLGSELNPEYAEMARARVEGRFNEYLAMKEGKPYMEGLFTEAQS